MSVTLDLTGNALLVDSITTTGSSTNASLGVNGVTITAGSGAPSASAAQGSLYLRTDGSSTSTRLYVNTNGSTGWTDFTSAT